jgi:fibronectin-binding autotransporter adhesin
MERTTTATRTFRILGLACSIFGAAVTVRAANTWDGGGADNNWSTLLNWDNDLVPLWPQLVTFGGSTRLTPNNDLSAITVNGINFGSTAGAFTLNGNGITLNPYRTTTGGFLAPNSGSISNNSTSAEIVAMPVTVASGSHAIFTTAAGGLNLTGALTRNVGGYVLFGQSTTGVINLTGTGLSNTNGILGGWAGFTTQAINLTAGNTLNPTGFAALDGSGNVVIAPASVYTDVIAGGAIASSAASNVRLTTSGTANTLSAAGTTDLNSLTLINTGADQTLNMSAAQTLRLGIGGVLNTSDAIGTRRNLTIGQTANQGVLTTSNPTGELFIMTTGLNAITSSSITVNAGIQDNGATPTKVVTAGYVVFNGTTGNTYTGGTYVTAGRIQTQFGALGTGDVHIYPGGQVLLNQAGTWTNNFFISGFGSGESGGIGAIRINGGDRILTGTITLEETAATGNGQIQGRITGPGGLIVGAGSANGSGTLTLGGPVANDYAGDTMVNNNAAIGGAAPAATNTLAFATGRNNVMPHGVGKGNLILNGIGGATPIQAIVNLNGTTQTINGLSSTGASLVDAIVQNALTGSTGTLIIGDGNATSTFGGVLRNNGGTGGTLAISKIGTGTQTLTGANTYTGATTVNGGTLALSTAGTNNISGSTNVTIGPNGTLDVSGVSGVFSPAIGQTIVNNGVVAGNINAAAGTLGGSGSYTGTVNLSGATVAPGSSTGAVSFNTLTASSGTLAIEIDGANSDIINVTNTATLAATGIQMSLISAATLPSYTIITAGNLSSAPSLINSTVGRTNFALAQVGNTIKVNVTGGPAALRWDNSAPATGNGTTWDAQGNQNWRNGAAPDLFYDFDTVTFDDTNNGHYAVNVSATVSPGSVTVNNSAGDYVLGGGTIAGAGAITKNGTSALTLSGLNTYSGGTVLNQGTLNINSANAIGTGTLTINGGALGNSFGSDIALNTNNAQIWAANVNFTGTTNNSLSLGTGAVTLNVNPVVTVDDNPSIAGSTTLTVSGQISNGAGNSITKAGNGTLTINGANTFTGGVTVNGGTVRFASGTSTATGNVTAGGTGTLTANTGGTLVLGQAQPNAITLAGGTLGGASGIASVPGELTAATGTTSTIYQADPQNLGDSVNTIAAVNSEMNFTNTLHGSGNLNLLASNNNINPDGGVGIRFRGTAVSDYSGTITVGRAVKAELQTVVTTPFSPIGTGKVVLTGGVALRDKTTASVVVLNGDTTTGYSEWNIRNNSSGNATLLNNYEMTGTGLSVINMLGSAPTNSVSQLANLRIGGGQELGTYRGTGNLHVVAFQSVTLTGGNATFSPKIPNFGADASTGADLSLGNIGEEVAGSGIIMNGRRLLMLAGNNTFTGGVTINEGVVQINNLGALNSTTPQLVTFGNVLGVVVTPTLRLNGFSVTAGGLDTSAFPAPPAAALVENANATPGTLTVSNTSDNTFGGTMQNGTGGGALSLTKAGTGRLTLSGPNTFTGAATVTGGILQVGNSTFNTGSLATTTVNVQNGTLQLGANAAAGVGLAATTNLTLGSGSNGGTFDLNGFAGTVSTLATSGIGTNRIGNSSAAPSTLTVNALSPFTFAGTIQNTLPSGGSSTTALTLAGGTVTLSGANTYTGVTTINGGNLIVTGSLAAAGNVMVNGGGTLSGTGGMGNVTSQPGSVLRPGLAPDDNIASNMPLTSLTVNGGDLQFELITPGNNDKFVVSGAAQFNGASTITPTSANTAVGNYTLLTATGGVSGTAPTAPVGARQTFTIHFGDATSGPNAITMNVVGAPKTLTWTGATNGVWDVGSTGPLNWSDTNSVAEKFFNLDSVIFGNGGTNKNITLNVAVSPADIVVNNDGSNPYSISGTGSIGGATDLTKSGVGTITLATNNTYSGTTTINGGTVQIGNGGTAGSLGTGPVVNNSNLTFNRSDAVSVANNISGTGVVQQSGTGVTTLTGTNTYSGGTSITSGTIQVAANEKLGDVAGALTFSGGTLNTTATFSTARGTTLNGTGGTFNVDPTTTLTHSGVIGGTGALGKSGQGTLVLSGNNTFTGGVVINDGIVQVGVAGALNTTTPNAVTFGANASGAKLQINAIDTAIGDLNTNASPGSPIVENGGATAATLTINTAGNDTYAGTLQNGGAGALAVTKTGTGKLTLTGTNTYTGTTTINGGTIEAGPAAAFAGLTGQVHFLSGTFHVTGNPGDTVVAATTSNKFTTSGTGGSTGTFDIDPGVTLVLGVQDSTTASLQTAGSGTAGSNFTKTGAGTLRIQDRNNQLDVALILQQGTIDATYPRALGGIDAAANFVDMRNGTNLILDRDTFANPTNSPAISGCDFLTGLRAGTAGGTANVIVDRATAGDGVTHAFGAIQSAGDFTLHVAPGANMVTGTAGLYIYPSISAQAGTPPVTAVPAAVLSGNATFDVANGTGVSTVMTINGGITGAGFGITKTGTGTLILANTPLGYTNNAASTYTGTTRVSQGILQLAAANLIPDASGMDMAGGTFNTGGFSETIGTLKVTNSSHIDLASTSALTFNDSTLVHWTNAKTLTIDNWISGADHIVVGTSNTTSLTPNQLNQIAFTNFPGQHAGYVGSTGELQPSTAALNLLNLGDVNHDAATNVGDIAASMNAVTDVSTYTASLTGSFFDGWPSQASAAIALADVNTDSLINNLDTQALIVYLANGGNGMNSPGGGSLTAVPEPASVTLLGLGFVALLAHQSRRRLPRRTN